MVLLLYAKGFSAECGGVECNGFISRLVRCRVTFDTAQGLQCTALLQLHRTSTKRPKFFEGKSRPRITTANVSCARLNVAVAFVVRSFVHALPGLSPASPDLVAFCCRGESISAGHLSPAVAVFPARVIPTDYVGSRLRGDRPRGHGRSRCTTAAITCSLIVHLDRDPMLTAR